MSSGTDDIVGSAETLHGFDDFEVSLGDTLRGERATLGYSLLDVQRDLRIKAEYLAAIEDANPDGFDGKGFIAGYVRSYARHLNLDPDWAFKKFCAESGFQGVHGFTPVPQKTVKALPSRGKMHGDASLGRSMPQVQPNPGFFAQLDPGALGSAAVLLALILGLGYGAWSVVQELQRVTVVPVEATPTLLADVDPLDPVAVSPDPVRSGTLALDVAPSVDAMGRLLRPQALDVPVVVSRDGPISTIDPQEVGTLAPIAPVAELAVAEDAPVGPQVVGGDVPEVVLLAAAPAWVRVRAADGTIVLEKVLEPGERFVLPATEEPASLRAGAAGSVYFEVNGQVYGPAGEPGSVASNVILSAEALREAYTVADLARDPELAAIVNVAEVSN